MGKQYPVIRTLGGSTIRVETEGAVFDGPATVYDGSAECECNRHRGTVKRNTDLGGQPCAERCECRWKNSLAWWRGHTRSLLSRLARYQLT